MAASYVAISTGYVTGDLDSVTCLSGALNVQTGDSLIAVVTFNSATEQTVAVAKDSGSPANTFTFNAADKLIPGGGYGCMFIGYLPSAAADATAVFKATLGATVTYPRIAIIQCRGGLNRDLSALASNWGDTLSSGNLATTKADAIVIGAQNNPNGDTLTGTPQINSIDGTTIWNYDSCGIWYRIVSETFTGPATAAISASRSWICGAFAMGATGGVGGSPGSIVTTITL